MYTCNTVQVWRDEEVSRTGKSVYIRVAQCKFGVTKKSAEQVNLYIYV